MILLAQDLSPTDVTELAQTLQGLDIVTSLVLLLVLLILILFGTLVVAVFFIRNIAKERGDETNLQREHLSVILKMQDNSNQATQTFSKMVRVWEREQQLRHRKEAMHQEYALRVETLVTDFARKILMQFDRLYKRIEELESRQHGIQEHPPPTATPVVLEKSEGSHGFGKPASYRSNNLRP